METIAPRAVAVRPISNPLGFSCYLLRLESFPHFGEYDSLPLPYPLRRYPECNSYFTERFVFKEALGEQFSLLGRQFVKYCSKKRHGFFLHQHIVVRKWQLEHMNLFQKERGRHIFCYLKYLFSLKKFS